MNTVDAVFAVRSGSAEQAQNLAKQQTIMSAAILGKALCCRDPTNGYTTSIPTISPLNFAIHDEILGGVTRPTFPDHERCDRTLRIIASGTTTFDASNIFRSVNSLQCPMRK